MRVWFQHLAPRCIAVAVFGAALGGLHSGWWQTGIDHAVGEPAHLLVYVTISATFVLAATGWYVTREPAWRRVAVASFLVPVSVIVELFGGDSASHGVAIAGVVLTGCSLLPLLLREENRLVRVVFVSGLIAALLYIVRHALLVWDPLPGPWIAGILVVLLLGGLFMAARAMPRFGGASVVVLVYGIIAGLDYTIASGMVLTSVSLLWLHVLALLIAAVAIDLLRDGPYSMAGAFAGFLFGAGEYAAAAYVMGAPFIYDTNATAVAIATTTLAGCLVGCIVGWWLRRHQSFAHPSLVL